MDKGGNECESLLKGIDIFVWLLENLVCILRLFREIFVKNELVKLVDICSEML